MGEAIIEVSGLGKSFGAVQAVKDLSFQVFKGEIFGFLGPNGAGKTTTINMLTGLARPDTGTITIGSTDCTSDRTSVQHLMGIVPDESSLYPELTGFENLCFCGALYGMRKRDREVKAKELLERVGLSDAGKRRFGGYSKGMARRLSIAAGVIHEPPILFLDEPTTGIDVMSARTVRSMLKELNDRGTTIFITTHYMEDAQRLCDRVAFINSGKVVRFGTMEELLSEDSEQVLFSLFPYDGEGPVESMSRLFPDISFKDQGEGLSAWSSSPIPVGAVVCALEREGWSVAEAKKVPLTLEDVFMAIAEGGKPL